MEARGGQPPEAAIRTKPMQKAGTRRPEKLERAEPDLIANSDRVQTQFVDGGSDELEPATFGVIRRQLI
jgi:hypothetical protein